jgi:hypothetical protein
MSGFRFYVNNKLNLEFIMAKAKKKSEWTHAGYVPTWIVGTNFCEYDVKFGDQVYLEPEPSNPADPNAMAVYNQKGHRVGYLPRYDAADFTPEFNAGRVVLKGLVTDDVRDYKAGLRLEVYTTGKANCWFKHSKKDDVRDIVHGNILDLWKHLDRYSYVTIKEYRNSLREMVHAGKVYHHTSILYRMLRGVMFDRQEAEFNQFRNALIDYLRTVKTGRAVGSKGLTVFPLFRKMKKYRKTTNEHLPGKLHLTSAALVKNYSYPQGAVGAICYCEGELEFIHIYKTPEQMELEWHSMLKPYIGQKFEPDNVDVAYAMKKVIREIRHAKMSVEINQDENTSKIEFPNLFIGSARLNHKCSFDEMEFRRVSEYMRYYY